MTIRRRLRQAPVTPLEAPQPPKMAGATPHIAVGNAHCATRLKDRVGRARFEPVAWWFTRSRIGRALRQQYDIPTELPSNLLAVFRQLDAIEGNQLFREFQRGDLGETADSAISTKDLVFASERSIAELDAPAPADPGRRS
jgi:hypothetical protein